MSIARRTALFACALALAVFPGVATAEEPTGSHDSATTAESTAPPAGTTEPPAEAPAEPIPTVPAAPPVMPTTVVRPSGVQGEPAAAHSAATATQPPATAAARPVAPQTGPPAAKPPIARLRSVSLGEHGVIELGRPPSAASRWRGFPISLSLRDAPLPEVLRSFARLAGVNLVLSPGVTGSVTVELKDVPWDQALWVILKTHGMGAEIDGRVWSVAPY